MKVWHSLGLVLTVLIATEALVDGNGETSTLEKAQSQIVQRTKEKSHPASVAKPEAPVKIARAPSWFAPDDETVQASSTPDSAMAQLQSPVRPFSLRAHSGSTTHDRFAPGPRLTTAGSPVRPIQIELIESSI